MLNRLSVMIIAKNEEDNIRRCLESVKWADEIIVLDSGSRDATVAIAKEFTQHVFETDWQGFGIQKQRALQRATGDWVLNLDADEFVNAELKEAILCAMASGTADAYRVPIRMCFYGKPLRFCSSPKRHVRLFKRQGACFSNDIVHEKIVLPKQSTIRQIKTPIFHQSFRDVSHALSKINLYSSYSAQIRINDNKKPSLLKTMASTSWMFFRCYVIQGGFIDGKSGLIFAIFNAQGSWYRGIKQLYRDK
ncbi:MAG: glycosyltransferase family 2 protein [Legionellaceae bacterium]|nr:glycosyltransferase family 2 protein [Legionellaceae bacterium]